MKNVLLLGGGGTLGIHTTSELLKLGYHIDNVCLESYTSDDPNLTYINARIDHAFLRDFLKDRHYDAIVDFLIYSNADDWNENRKDLLLDSADQLIFLSSYRVYADEEHPIKETSPQWLDVTHDSWLLKFEGYALPKSRCERYLRASEKKNWTIVRPIISFSHFRLDLVTVPSGLLFDRILNHKKILLPAAAKELTAGVNWAGNIGKQIAHLVCNEKALGEAFTLGSGENLTWGQVADLYTELFGAEFVWVDSADYIHTTSSNNLEAYWITFLDRLFDRKVDVSKVFSVTGLTENDMMKIPDALKFEMQEILSNPAWKTRMLNGSSASMNAKIDAYLAAHGL